MQTSSHGNIISNLDRKKRCIGEITCFTPATLLLSRKPHLSSHIANNYADDALRAFLHFLQAFTPVFALEVMHIPQQIVKVFLLISLSSPVGISQYFWWKELLLLLKGNEVFYSEQKRKWKPSILVVVSFQQMESLQCKVCAPFLLFSPR